MAQPTTAVWHDLHAAFADYCHVEPWRFFGDSDLIACDGELRGEEGYGIVTGAAGTAYGLALYLGDEGLAAYHRTMSDELDPESPEAVHVLNAIWALRVDREQLRSADLAVIRTLGIRFRGRGRWPLFRRLMPGYAPWHLDAEEARFLTRALRTVTGLTPDPPGRREPAAAADPARLPARRREPAGRLGPAPHPQESALPESTDELRLRRLVRSRRRGTSVWEVDSFFLGAPVQERSGSRPYYPTVVLAVDGRSGAILGAEILGERPSTAERRDRLVDLLEGADRLPAEIVVDSSASARLVEPVAAGLGIRLSVGDAPALAEAREALREEALQ